jgi:hypothetical protein
LNIFNIIGISTSSRLLSDAEAVNPTATETKPSDNKTAEPVMPKETEKTVGM